ncbi:MAG TPA: hypothetical protein VIH42_15230 [Thermoguttaceae bacterium]
MNKVPYNMRDNFSYECPLSGKTFEFTRDKTSQNEAFAAQQAHTATEMQRLERLAGRRLNYRDLIRSSRMEREQAAHQARAKATDSQQDSREAPVKKPVNKEPPEHPFVTAVYGNCSPYVH